MTIAPPAAAPGDEAPAGGVEGQLVYAIGDVHGCYGLLRELLDRIADDAKESAHGRRPILILLGDLIDRGPHSAQVMEAATWLGRFDRFEFHLLMGNHEKAMLDFIDQPAACAEWLLFGGDATLRCYGVTPPETGASARSLVATRDALLQRMPASHLRSLQQARSMVTLGDYAFVHAGIRPGTPLAEQDEDDLLWIGSEFTASAEQFEKIVVHGHTIDQEARFLPNRIGIDTGAYQSGRLTALRIEDGRTRLFQTGGEGIDAAPR